MDSQIWVANWCLLRTTNLRIHMGLHKGDGMEFPCHGHHLHTCRKQSSLQREGVPRRLLRSPSPTCTMELGYFPLTLSHLPFGMQMSLGSGSFWGACFWLQQVPSISFGQASWILHMGCSTSMPHFLERQHRMQVQECSERTLCGVYTSHSTLGAQAYSLNRSGLWVRPIHWNSHFPQFTSRSSTYKFLENIPQIDPTLAFLWLCILVF